MENHRELIDYEGALGLTEYQKAECAFDKSLSNACSHLVYTHICIAALSALLAEFVFSAHLFQIDTDALFVLRVIGMGILIESMLCVLYLGSSLIYKAFSSQRWKGILI